MPTATPTPSPALVVLDPTRVDPIVEETTCPKPQLPGETCTLQSPLVVSQARVSLRPQVEVRVLFGAPYGVRITSAPRSFQATSTTSGFFDLRPEEREAFIFHVDVRGDAKAGSYGPITFVLKLPGEVGVYREVKSFPLIEKIVVEPALELTELEKLECGVLRVGEECLAFRATIKNHARIARTGELSVVFHNAAGRQMGKPAGLQLLQQCGEEERRPLGAVALAGQTTVTCDVVIGVAAGTAAVEVGSLELVS